MKDKEFILLLEKNIRGGVSTILGERHIIEAQETNLIYRCNFSIWMGYEPISSYWRIQKFTFPEYQRSAQL